MYNLLISGGAGAWDGRLYEFSRDRVLQEYTDPVLLERYGALDTEAMAALTSFPALFAYETNVKAPAHVGVVDRLIVRSKSVRVQYHFLPEIPPISPSDLKGLSWELDIDDWELNRTHWAVKNVDLITILREAGLISSDFKQQFNTVTPGGSHAPLIVTPLVFSNPGTQQEPDLVAVMMPFSANFNPVYASIQRACQSVGLRTERADNIWLESAVIQDIFNLMVRSKFVVVDFTGRNPNVMYETGIAHTLGRPVVPISQSIEDVPFDLRHHRILRYLPNTQGLEEMEKPLAARLETLSQQS